MVELPEDREPTHPGEMLRYEFLEPMGVTQTRLADEIGVPYQRVNEIINGKRGVTPDTAIRLARFFDMSPGFWINLQMQYDLWEALQSIDNSELERIQPLKRGKAVHA